MQYGNILRNLEQNHKASLIYKQAADVAAQQKNKAHESASLIYMGICEKENNNRSQCLRYWRQALELNPADIGLQRNIEDLERQIK